MLDKQIWELRYVESLLTYLSLIKSLVLKHRKWSSMKRRADNLSVF